MSNGKKIFTAAEEAAKKASREKALVTMRANLAIIEGQARELITKGDSMTDDDRRALLALIKVSYHDSGKIEGVWSVDGSAACSFCQKMIAAAEDNILMICGSCYAAADAYKEAAWRRHQVNALILSSVLFTAEELKALSIDGPLVRFNEDGDTVNATHARNLLRIAETRPGMRFGYWFKNAPAVEAGLAAEGVTTRETLPENIRFIHSSALIGFPVRPAWFADAVFTVYPDAETTEAAIKAGAHECNGRRCRACGYTCYMQSRRPEPMHIAEILRCSKTRRAVILAAYHARKARLAAA